MKNGNISKNYLKDKRVLHLIEKLKKLEEEIQRRHEIFFAENLKSLKKYEAKGGE